MSKQRVSDRDIHVWVTKHYSGDSEDKPVYNMSIYGEGMPVELTGEDALELARCLNHAVECSEGKTKGGES